MKNRIEVPILLIISLLSTLYAKKPDILIKRSEDNNRAIKADTTDWKFHRIIKQIPLSKRKGFAHISFGGDIRLQYQDTRNINFGDVKPGDLTDENYLQQRYMLHTDLQISPYFRSFAQLTSNHIAGNKEITPHIDVNELDITQLFGELIIPIKPATITLRGGRQELSYGTSRMIGLREGPCVRTSFDGAKLYLRNKKIKADLFYLLPVTSNRGVFDDEPNHDVQIFGSYFTYKPKDLPNFDLYYIGAERKTAYNVDKSAPETRHSLGGRIFYRNSDINANLEATYQFGSFGDEDIHAYQLAFITTYTIPTGRVKPIVGLMANIFSGDKERGDGKNGTFRPVNAKPLCESPLSFGSANLYTLAPTVGVNILKKLTVNANYLAAWRYSTNDYIYNVPMNRTIRPSGPSQKPKSVTGKSPSKGKPTITPSDDQFCAQLFELELKLKLNKHFYMFVTGGTVIPGDYVLATGDGETMNYAKTGIRYRF